MALLWHLTLLSFVLIQRGTCDVNGTKPTPPPVPALKPEIVADVASAILGSIFPAIPVGQDDQEQKIDKRQFYNYPGNYYPPMNRGLPRRTDPYAGYNPYESYDRFPAVRPYEPRSSYPAYSFNYDREPPMEYIPRSRYDHSVLSTQSYPAFPSPDELSYFRTDSYPSSRYGSRGMQPGRSPFPSPTLASYTDPRARAELFNSYQQPLRSLLRGRTDLPPSYVYPFAKQGTLITPDQQGNQIFGLSNEPLPQMPASRFDDYYSPRQDPRQYDRMYPYPQEPRRYPIYPTSLYPSRHFSKRGENDTATENTPDSTDKDPVVAKFENDLKQLAKSSLQSSEPIKSTTLAPEDDVRFKKASADKKKKKEREGVALKKAEKKEESKTLADLKEKPKEKLAVQETYEEQKSRPDIRRRQPKPENPVKPKDYPTATCPDCLPFNATMAIGSFSLVYGNPKSLELVYSSLAILTLPQDKNGVHDFFTPGCVELDAEHLELVSGSLIYGSRIACMVEPYVKVSRTEDVLPISFTYSVNDTNKVHVSRGTLSHDVAGNSFAFNFGPVFSLPALLFAAVCLLKAHVNPILGYDYLVLTETEGEDRCRSLHIFARDRSNFDNLYTAQVGRYLKKELDAGRVNPVQRVVNPDLCSRNKQ